MSIIRTAMCWWYNMDIFSYLTWNNSSLEEEEEKLIFFGCSFGDLKVLVLVTKKKRKMARLYFNYMHLCDLPRA